ncbi:FAD binding domain-containing protein [Engelhardtia mirabilis]|uniref:4-hydroxybenzoyl-CoA reductase subunit beta n=1 Tax=Engelhardtia mirabilis TaxID=2528011 RepID=A0A518BS54_9BACT|nr:4-hydroxybenzoyl-CoA reductase subunit beta [Planctomycetes bacterium Pla133]QDV04121.1 4-hydroxybenzoyl-CoA reductase subunit beta [Planctomycetes bacterium Pla86]
MKNFELARPTTLNQAVMALAEGEGAIGGGKGPAALLAGGQDLLTELKEHLAEPDTVIDLGRVPGLDAIERDGAGNLTIGAMVRLHQLEEHGAIREQMPVLAQAATSIASPQIRSVGTVGGNLNQRPRCWYYRNEASVCLKKGGLACLAAVGRNKYNAILGGGPSYIVHPSDLAPALIALDAEVTLVGPEGERRMPLADFYLLPREGGISTETVRRPGEVLTKVHVPAPAAGTRSTYLKFKERESYDWALSSVALVLGMDGARVNRARIVLGGVAPKPWRVESAERLLEDNEIDPRTVAQVREAALFGAQPLAENGYKVPLTKGLITRALESLA